MVQLSPRDASALSRLVQFGGLPPKKRNQILGDIESVDAREVGEAVLDQEKYNQARPDVRATVDRFNQWLEANKKIGLARRSRRQNRR